MPLFADPGTTPLRLTMLALVGLVGAVTMHYTARALAGAPYRRRALGWFAATLAAALLVISADDLVVLALGWTATSLALHQLLTLIPGRVPAEVGAHKKFMVSRVADVAIGAAILLIANTLGTTAVPELLAQTATMASLPWTLDLAAVLLVVAVVLRSAQLPVHGWLLHVMEAPTPVSALLHAGIINIGAFVVILLGGFIGKSVLAMSLLVLFGGVTAILAGLTMLTRANVKGALAWSTSAQMGFVLVECGIGAYPVALLHVVAHALYKAQAFLASGQVRRPRVDAGPVRPTTRAWLVGTLAAVVVTGGMIALTWGDALSQRAVQVTAVLAVLSMVPLLARAVMQRGWRARRDAAAYALGLPLLYALWHTLAAPLVPATSVGTTPLALAALVIAGFAGLLIVQGIVLTAPSSAFARALYPHALQGFHLDDLLTRFTFRLWPPAPAVLRTSTTVTSAARRAERAA